MAQDASAPEGEEGGNFDIYIGLALSLTSSSMNALGMNVQRLAGNAPAPGEKPGFRKMLSALGIFLSTACGLVDAASYGFAPQSTLAPLGAATLVINLLLAPIIHGTKLALQDALFTVVIVAGVVLCIFGGSSEERVFSIDDLYALPTLPGVQATVGVLLAAILALGIHVRTAEAKGRGALLSTGVGYPMIAGMLGGATVVSAKLLTNAIKLGAPLWTLTVPIGVCVSICGVSQVAVNNRGLSKHAPLVMVPVFSSTFVVSNAVGAMVVFSNGLDSMAATQWAFYGAGVLCVVTGVLLIARAAAAAASAAKARLELSGAVQRSSGKSPRGSSGSKCSPKLHTPTSPRNRGGGE